MVLIFTYEVKMMHRTLGYFVVFSFPQPRFVLGSIFNFFFYVDVAY